MDGRLTGGVGGEAAEDEAGEGLLGHLGLPPPRRELAVARGGDQALEVVGWGALWCQLCPVKDAAPILPIAVF